MRRVRQDLSALFGAIGRPAFSTFVCWGCTALAYPLAIRGGYAGSVGAALVFCLSVLFLAYLLGSGALAFVVDSKRSCLPGSQRLARRANLLASLLLLPSIVLSVAALAGNPIWPAWVPTVLVLAIALAGVLAPRRPTSAVGLLLLIVLAAYWAANARGDHERGKEWLFVLLATALVLVSAAVPLLAAVKWHRMIRPGSLSPSLAERLRTLYNRIDQRGALWHTARTASSGHGFRKPLSPARIVGTCLGGMFAKPSRQLIIGAVLLILFVMAEISLPRLGGNATPWIVTSLALAAGGLVSTGFLTRLSSLTRGQIGELALMPGLGDPAAQRRTLYRAILTPPLLWLGVVWLFGSADLLLNEQTLSSIGMLAVALFILWLTYTLFAMQKLATLPPKHQSFISELMLFYLIVWASWNYYWVYSAHPQFRLWFWFWITPALLSIGIAGAIGFSARRIATAAHPFLSRDSMRRFPGARSM